MKVSSAGFNWELVVAPLQLEQNDAAEHLGKKKKHTEPNEALEKVKARRRKLAPA